MKKIFTLCAVALVASASMNAQTPAATYYFNSNPATYSLSGSESGNAFTATTYTMDGTEGFSVNYSTASEKGYVYLAANDNIYFEYSNSSTKNNVVKTSSAMFVCDSKNFVLNVKNLKADDEVYLLYSAKGSSAANLTNADNANTLVMDDAVKTNATKADNEGNDMEGKYALSLMHVKAVANGGIKIKEISAGMRVFGIGVNAVPDLTSGISNVAVTETKTVKMFCNGQMILVKDGVSYNLLGQVIK